MAKRWFKGSTEGETFYAITSTDEMEYSLVGDSVNVDPTPSEILKTLQDGKRIFDETRSSVAYEYVESKSGLEKSALPDGAYTYKESSYTLPERLMPINIRKDSAIKRNIGSRINKEIKMFIESEETYRKLKVQFRRGLLMYGPPGEGKTTIIRQTIKKYKDKAIIIFLNEIPSALMLKSLNEIEKNRFKIIVIEELATMIEDNDSGMDIILDFLDGETSLDKSLIVATTNYPHRLPANIAQRHSRFDLILEVSYPSEDEIRKLIKHFLNEVPVTIDTKPLLGLSTAAIKEVCLYSIIKNVTVNVAAEEILQRIAEAKEKFGEYEEEE